MPSRKEPEDKRTADTKREGIVKPRRIRRRRENGDLNDDDDDGAGVYYEPDSEPADINMNDNEENDNKNENENNEEEEEEEEDEDVGPGAEDVLEPDEDGFVYMSDNDDNDDDEEGNTLIRSSTSDRAGAIGSSAVSDGVSIESVFARVTASDVLAGTVSHVNVNVKTRWDVSRWKDTRYIIDEDEEGAPSGAPLSGNRDEGEGEGEGEGEEETGIRSCLADGRHKANRTCSYSNTNTNRSTSVNAKKDKKNRGCCAICLEEMYGSPMLLVELPCHHLFHEHCIEEWLNSPIHPSRAEATCPVCRRKMERK